MCKDKIEDFGNFAQNMENELNITKDMGFIKKIFKKRNPDKLVNIVRQ
jgi:hypothetical protein